MVAVSMTHQARGPVDALFDSADACKVWVDDATFAKATIPLRKPNFRVRPTVARWWSTGTASQIKTNPAASNGWNTSPTEPNPDVTAAELHGRAGQLAGCRERAGFGVVFAGSNHDSRFAAPPAIRVGVLDEAGLFLGATQTPGRPRDPKRAVARRHDERPRSAPGQRDGRQANCTTQRQGTRPILRLSCPHATSKSATPPAASSRVGTTPQPQQRVFSRMTSQSAKAWNRRERYGREG